MTCTFFGHRDAHESIKGSIKEAIIELVETESVTNFLVGNEGAFDRMVQSALSELKVLYPCIEYSIVLSSMPKKGEASGNTIFPEEVAASPRKFAVDKRNRWMIKRAEYAVVYVVRITGGASKFANIARKKCKKVVEILPRLG